MAKLGQNKELRQRFNQLQILCNLLLLCRPHPKVRLKIGFIASGGSKPLRCLSSASA